MENQEEGSRFIPYPLRPRAMTAKTNWTARIGRLRSKAIAGTYVIYCRSRISLILVKKTKKKMKKVCR